MASSTDPLRNEYDMIVKVTAWPTEGQTLAWASYWSARAPLLACETAG